MSKPLLNPEDLQPQGEDVGRLIEEALDDGFLASKGRPPRGADERKHWLRDENGAQVLNSIPPIAFAAQLAPGVDLGDPRSFLTPVVSFTPVVNPLFHALMVRLGATPQGARTYEVSARKGKNAAERDQIVKNLKAILEVVPGSICYPPNCVEQGEKKGFQSWNISRYKVFRDIYCLIRDTSAGEYIERSILHSITHDHPTPKALASGIASGEDISRLAPLAGAAIVISRAKGRLFFKLCTNRLDGQGLYLSEDPAFPDLDRFRPAGRLSPQMVTPDVAVSMAHSARAQGYEVLDPTGDLEQLSDLLSELVIAQRIPGSPGQSRLVVGQGVQLPLAGDDVRFSEPPDSNLRIGIVPAAIAGQAVESSLAAGVSAIIDEQVSDIIRMASASPVPPDQEDAPLRLRPYQREAVGLHAATSVGYLQACSVGLGKTAITLRGMREHALA